MSLVIQGVKKILTIFGGLELYYTKVNKYDFKYFFLYTRLDSESSPKILLLIFFTLGGFSVGHAIYLCEAFP